MKSNQKITGKDGKKWKEMQRERRQMKRNTNVKGIARQNLETFNESTVLSHNVGCMNLSCHECGALMFAQEKSIPVQGNASKRAFSLCCSYGAVKLPPLK